MHIGETSFEASLNTLQEVSRMDKHVVIDNTPLPKDGSFSEESLTTMMLIRTQYEMNYDI